MDKEQARTTARSLGIINLILGIWLILSPFIFSYESGAMTNSIVLGIVVAILAIIRLSAPSQTWASWLNGIAGLWLIVSPFIFGFMQTALLWDQIIVGIVVAVLGFWNGTLAMPMKPTHHITQ